MDGGLATRITLAALPVAAGLARNFAGRTVREWQLIDLVERVELLVTEVVTNALKATGAAQRGRQSEVLRFISLRLRTDGWRVVIEVADDDVSPPVLGRPGLDAEGGRGLLLVDVLSSSWGYFHPPSGGKVVWCELTPLADDQNNRDAGSSAPRNAS